MLKNDIDKNVFETIFGMNKERARKKIRKLASNSGIFPCSILPFYKKIAEGELSGFTVPAFNIRTLTYDFARAIFRAAKRSEAGLFIFELARQEREYTNQSFDEYVSCILSSALKEKFYYPVFIQADHVQLSREKFLNSPEEELRAIKNLIREAISAGVYNIDIDASTLVNLEKESKKEQQKNNFKITAQLIKFIRENQPQNIIINIGAEIGEIGKKLSTSQDLRAFMDGLEEELNGKIEGISKISIQTGTTHGGIVLPDGKIAKVNIDFETIKELSRISRNEYGLAGVVQHGASTLPLRLFSRFPNSGCIEIHLATGIQNIFFESKEIPEELKKEMTSYIKRKFAEKGSRFATEEQFVYKTRKYALGEFKREIWELPQDIKDAISDRIERWAFKIFNILKVNGTLQLIYNTKSNKFQFFTLQNYFFI